MTSAASGVLCRAKGEPTASDPRIVSSAAPASVLDVPPAAPASCRAPPPPSLRPDGPGASGGGSPGLLTPPPARAASTRSSGEGVSNAKRATPSAGGTGGASG